MNITDAAYWMKNDENISSDDNDEEMNARDCFFSDYDWSEN